MKHFLTVLAAFLAVLTLCSCGNLTLTWKNGQAAQTAGSTSFNEEAAVQKGKLVIRVPAGPADGADRAVSFQTQNDVTAYSVSISTSDGQSIRQDDNLTPAQLNNGLTYELNPGEYSIFIWAYKESAVLFEGKSVNADGIAASAAVTAGQDTTVTVKMTKTIALVENNGAEAGSAEGLELYGIRYLWNETAPGITATESTWAISTAMLSTNPSFTSAGNLIIGFEDQVNTDSNGNKLIYERDEAIDLNDKVLPLHLKAVWGSATVTYHFDSNYTEGLETEDTTVDRYSEITMPAYKVSYVDGTTRGVFANDENYTLGQDLKPYFPMEQELWKRGNYYFCGWAVNEAMPEVDPGLYDDTIELFKNTVIVQPGEKYTVKGNVTFHAVWVDTSVQLIDVLYVWGDGRYDYGAQMHLRYIIDNIRDDDGDDLTEYHATLKIPEISDLFPQYDELPDNLKTDTWYYSAETDSDVTEGTFIEYDEEDADNNGEYTVYLQYPLDIWMGDLQTGTENQEIHEYTFPLPQEMTIPTVSKLKEDGYLVETADQFLDKWYLDDPDTPLEDGATITLTEDQRYLRNNLPIVVNALWKSSPTGFVKINGTMVTNQPSNVVSNGPFIDTNLPLYVDSFFMAETETTWERWVEVYNWAVQNGYTFTNTGNPGSYINDDQACCGNSIPSENPITYGNTGNSAQPVSNISFRDCVVWCNAASEKENLTPVYYIGESVAKDSKNSSVDSATIQADADGYRLPTQAEWEYAARGGNPNDSTNWNYTYAGANPSGLNSVAVYTSTSNSRTADVKSKTANAAGLYDMSGNLWEYIWLSGSNAGIRGGSFHNDEIYCAVSDVSQTLQKSKKGPDKGFRVVRSIPQKKPLKGTMVPINGATVKASVGNSDGAFYSINEVDSSTYITVDSFKIGETELTYEDWFEVYIWAKSHEYTFTRKGKPGSEGSDGEYLSDTNKAQPVVNISWRDMIVWCNAASERAGLEPVYYLSGTTNFKDTSKVLRNTGSATAGSGEPEHSVLNEDANGYRLPTRTEWEFAARGGNPDSEIWNYNYAGSTTLDDVAVYNTDKSAAVKSKGEDSCNSAGLYDMTGNVWEYVDEIVGNNVTCKGGGYQVSLEKVNMMDLSYKIQYELNSLYKYIGFRVAQNAN